MTWTKRINEAQTQTTVEIAGATYRRVPYGADYPDAAERCRDCAVALGQYHVPDCCVERCSRCGGQAITCCCFDLPSVH